jgi:hypothetical protein
VETVGTRKMRLNRDGYISEIIHGRATGLYHYVITKGDSPEIVAWGQEESLEGARQSIDNFIDHDKNRKRTAG